MKKKQVFVYVDCDHGDIEVFDTLKKAKDHAEQNWPDIEEGWDDGDSRGIYLGEYVHVYTKEVL